MNDDPKMRVRKAARLSVAPMMDWTDSHCRVFHRLMSRETLLYTEMVTAPALVRGGATHLLDFEPAEHPVALQLGGSDPAELAEATRMAVDHGYDEVNLNVGCPSDRVQSGTFGAVLMRDPDLVARCCAAMIDAAGDVEVTVKCRIGVDDQVPAEALPALLQAVRAKGIRTAIIHARKAWLKGLSPKDNRTIPPLDYALVQQVKADFPDMEIILNGGLETLSAGLAAQGPLDGIMLGRAAYHTPWELAQVDSRVYGQPDPVSTPHEAVVSYLPYIVEQLHRGTRLHSITRHMLGLFHGRAGARQWRRILSERAVRDDAGIDVVEDALAAVEPEMASA